MAASAHVLQLIRAHYRRDEAAFVAAAQALARGAKVPRVTGAIMDVLRHGYAGRASTEAKAPQPTYESNPLVQVGGMLQQLRPTTFAELMLDRELQFLLDEFVVELEYREALAERNLTPRSRLLFHGPPGNGKSSAAAAIASAIGVPAYAVNFAQLISKYVGATGENLGKLFQSLQPNTVVVFDEIDAIGSGRGSTEQASGKESNGIVNTLLTLLDRSDRGIIVATTNRPDILDPALMRRFDAHVLFPEPNVAQKHSLAERICDGHGVDVIDCDDCSNFDEVTKRCKTHARRVVMRELLAADSEAGGPNGTQEEESETIH